MTPALLQVGAGQPHCIDEPQPANCDAFDSSAKANNCSQYCSEVLRFVTAPRPGAWHDPDSESALDLSPFCRPIRDY